MTYTVIALLQHCAVREGKKIKECSKAPYMELL